MKREMPSDNPAFGNGDSVLPPRRGRRRGCPFCGTDASGVTPTIDYKDPQSLKYFITERG